MKTSIKSVKQAKAGTTASSPVRSRPVRVKDASVAKPVQVPALPLERAQALKSPRIKQAAQQQKRHVQPVAQGVLPLFQFFQLPQQRPFLDPVFEPCSSVVQQQDGFDEFAALAALAARRDLQQARLWGVVGADFGDKTGLTGEDLREHVAHHPGYDAYFINPSPVLEALFHNAWQQAETTHPHFLVLCREFFKAAGLPLEALAEIQHPRNCASANYIVASPAFWSSYIGFVCNALSQARKALSQATRDMLCSVPSDTTVLTVKASYLRMIVDRLLPIFLQTAPGRSFKVCKIAARTAGTSNDVHARLLADMKAVACQTKSKWLVTCWLNYRNLYFSASQGEAWTSKHLNSVTPPAVHFPAHEAAVDMHSAAGEAVPASIPRIGAGVQV